MLKVHVAEHVAGLIAPTRPLRRVSSIAVPMTILIAVVGLVGLYYTVREMAQPDPTGMAVVDDIARIAPAAGPDRLMSLEEIKRRAGQD